MILAAIDIGSNAARLLITEVATQTKNVTYFNKINLIRIPLRLGFDVFKDQKISDEKISMMLESMKAYKHLMNAYKVEAYKACATSAMRDASNAPDIIRQIKKQTGIQIEIITGDNEAQLLFESHVAETLTTDKSYLYIDVGGGSTELSFFANGEMVSRRSFNIGTIRLLQRSVTEDNWNELKAYIKSLSKSFKNIEAIGSGGNINKVFSISKRKDGKPLHIELLREYYKELEGVSLEDRIHKYALRADRADVIVPALSIYINVMRWAGADEIYVPKIGLADGLIKQLWNELGTKAT